MRAISLWDAEYGCAPFLLATADIPAEKSFGCGPICACSVHRHRTKDVGAIRFMVQSSSSRILHLVAAGCRLWDADPDLGKIRVQLWNDLHFRKATPVQCAVARIERLESKGARRLPKLIWIAWIGEEPPEQNTWCQCYMRRYAVDHWYRFAKQRLHWTIPMFSTPEQGERWSDLMPFITWELWLARPIGIDKPLPWQKTQTELDAGRVCQGMTEIFAQIGTPADRRNRVEMLPVGPKAAHASPDNALTWSKGTQKPPKKAPQTA